MKCSYCGMELSPSAKKCSNCGKSVPQAGFNYKNMEKELVNTVLEEEAIDGISGKSSLYQKHTSEAFDEDDEDETEKEVKKQPAKLAVAFLTSAAVLAGGVFFLQTFSTEYEYDSTEAEYQRCLTMMAEEDYSEAMKSVDLLLKQENDSLEYLALKNTICEKTGDKEEQTEVLRQIIAADADNYQAYEKLLGVYLEKEDQDAIVELALNAPNSAIASMLQEYLVDAPYLELTPGVYDTSQELVITSEGGNSIYYTLDGSSPQEKGVLYLAPIPLEQDRFYTVRAICKNERGAYGEESTGDYQIGINAVRIPTTTEVEEPTVYPSSGTYSTPQRITIDVPIGYQAYYSWTLGMELTPENGTLYTGGITMPEGSSVLSVIITDGNGNCSSVKQVTYSYGN